MDNFEWICPSSQSANQRTDTSSAVINDDTNGNLSGDYLQSILMTLASLLKVLVIV